MLPVTLGPMATLLQPFNVTFRLGAHNDEVRKGRVCHGMLCARRA
jgi:hypothetical protein